MQGRHVRLEPLQPWHADELWPEADDTAMRRWWPRRWESVDDVRDQFAMLAAQTHAKPWLVRDATGHAIGSSTIYQIDGHHRNALIGWTWFIPSARRTAANSETKLLLLEHCFETLGLLRVRFDVDARNTVSQAAVARLGAVHEGTLRQDKVCWDGFVRDTTVWSILAAEWPDVKARLQGRLDAHAGLAADATSS